MKKTLLIILVLSFVFSAFSQKKPRVKDNPHARQSYLFEKIKSPLTGKVPDNIRQKELAFVKSDKAGLINHQKANLTTWINRGPWNVGGRTRAMAIDVANSNVILAAGVSGGLWRSTDAGSSWTRVSMPLDAHSLAITAIAQDPRTGHQQTWYYVTGEYSGNSASEYGAAYSGSGIYKSTDNGLNWTQIVTAGSPVTFDSFFDYCWNVKVNPMNGDVYVATYGGIFKSTDGTNFSAILFSTTVSNYSAYTDVDISSNGTIYATMSYEGDKTGVWQSTDNGSSWTDITPSTFDSDYERIVIAVCPSDANKIYFLGARDSYDGNQNQRHLLWIYNNSTSSWTDKSSMLPAAGGYTGNFESQGGYDLVIKVKPDNSSVVFIGGVSLYRTTDGFTNSSNLTWVGGYTPSSTSSYALYTNHHADQHSLFFDPNNTAHLYSGHDGGISYTADCLDNTANSRSETIDWTSVNNGYLTTQAYTVAIDQSGTAANDIISGFQDNGSWFVQSTNPSSAWGEINSGDGAYCAIADNATAYYSSSQNGNVYADYFTSGGSYIGYSRINPDLVDPLFITPFVIDQNDNDIMYMLDYDYIWRNNNLSEQRNHLSSDVAPSDWVKLSNSYISSGYYSAIAVSKTPANIVYAGTSNGKIYKFTNPNTTNPTPTDVTDAAMPTGYVSSIAVDPYNADFAIVTFSNYEIISIYYTENGGTTWTNASNNLEQNWDGSGDGPSVRWAAILKSGANNVYFVGTSTGLFFSPDLNGAWYQEGVSIIGNVLVDMITTRSSDGLVVVGTHGNGMYSGQYAADIKDVSAVPLELQLFPNPVVSKININVIYNQSKFMIHNADGQVVFYSDIKTMGTKSFDLSSLPQGVYIARLYSAEKVSEAKFIKQ